MKRILLALMAVVTLFFSANAQTANSKAISAQASDAQETSAEKNKAEKNKAKETRTETDVKGTRTERARTEETDAKETRAERARTERARTERARTEKNKAKEVRTEVTDVKETRTEVTNNVKGARAEVTNNVKGARAKANGAQATYTNVIRVYENNSSEPVATYTNTSDVKYRVELATVVSSPEVTPSADGNLLSGEFSVSDSKVVQFTKGNLYWNGSGYAFEDGQTSFADAWDATHVGLFFWTSSSDYKTSGKEPYAESFAYSTQTTSDAFFCGEDNMMTVNGTSGLYVLSSNEWKYLLTGRTNSSILFRKNVKVGSISGCFIIAPDNSTATVNPIQDSYTADEWSTAEGNGFVCLVPAGYRDGNSLLSMNIGYYWSSTPSTDQSVSYALCLQFNLNEAYPAKSLSRSRGRSIRLVKTIE